MGSGASARPAVPPGGSSRQSISQVGYPRALSPSAPPPYSPQRQPSVRGYYPAQRQPAVGGYYPAQRQPAVGNYDPSAMEGHPLWDRGTDTTHDLTLSRVLAADEHMMQMSACDKSIATLREAGSNEDALERIRDQLGIRGHLQDELLRIQAMLAQTDRNLSHLEPFEADFPLVVKGLRELNARDQVIQAITTNPSTTATPGGIEQHSEHVGVVSKSTGVTLDPRIIGVTIETQTAVAGRDDERLKNELNEKDEPMALTEDELHRKHRQEEDTVSLNYAAKIGKQNLSRGDVDQLLTEHLISMQALRAKQEMERSKLQRLLDDKKNDRLRDRQQNRHTLDKIPEVSVLKQKSVLPPNQKKMTPDGANSQLVKNKKPERMMSESDDEFEEENDVIQAFVAGSTLGKNAADASDEEFGDFQADEPNVNRLRKEEPSQNNLTMGDVTTNELKSGDLMTGNHTTGNHTTGDLMTGNHMTGDVTTGNHTTGNHMTVDVTTADVANEEEENLRTTLQEDLWKNIGDIEEFKAKMEKYRIDCDMKDDAAGAAEDDEDDEEDEEDRDMSSIDSTEFDEDKEFVEKFCSGLTQASDSDIQQDIQRHLGLDSGTMTEEERSLQAELERKLTNQRHELSEADVTALLADYRRRQNELQRQRSRTNDKMDDLLKAKLEEKKRRALEKMDEPRNDDENFFQRLQQLQRAGTLTEEEFNRMLNDHLNQMNQERNQTKGEWRSASQKKKREANARDVATSLVLEHQENTKQLSQLRQGEQARLDSQLQKKLAMKSRGK